MPTCAIAVASTVSDLKALDAGLYSHTKRVLTFAHPGKVAAVLVTTAITDTEARYLAEYQCGRLQSGSFYARVHSSVAEALADPDFQYNVSRIELLVAVAAEQQVSS